MDVEKIIQIVSIDSDPDRLQSWNQFVNNSSTTSFYHRSEWKDIYESEFRHRTFYLAHMDGKSVDGVLPLVFIRSRVFGRILCSLPFLNYCGPATTGPVIEKALMDRACEIASSERADYMELRAKHACSGDLQVSEEKISLTVPLEDDPDSLWNSFKSKHRTNIRRVYKAGLTVQVGHDDLLDPFYEIMCDSWRSLGTPIYSKSYFRTILNEFGDDVQIFVAYSGVTPVATAFNGLFKDTVEGMWAGTVFEHRTLQSNYLLYWEMIKHACESGYRNFHLGRSSVDSGAELFKRKWGAESQQLYWQYFLPQGGDMPQLNNKNAKYAFAIKTWQRLPIWATQILGPRISRNIP